MKIRNLKIRIAQKIAALLFAASGFLSTSFVCSAQDIALGDPSFEAFAVPILGYAYSDTYRPTSAWIDDPDDAAGGPYHEDDGNSNWLFTADYGTGRRATPRTGIQAMHGLNGLQGGYYNGQVAVGEVFEANKTYTFSIWSQGDDDPDVPGDSSRVWLYIYDGSVDFSEANSLEFARFAPDTGDFVNRDPAWTDAESQAGWTQISISHTVQPGAPEIGNPIGVVFWAARDGAVDDATLTASAPGAVTPDSVSPTEGDFVSGGIAELAESDDLDYSMRRRSADLQSRTEFEVKSTSPTETPTTFEFTLEGSVFARGNVVQTIELFDYDAGVWELIDTSDSNRAPMPDKVVTATPTGDFSRFVEAGTMCIEARILYKSDRARQKFASNTDQAIWTIQ